MTMNPSYSMGQYGTGQYGGYYPNVQYYGQQQAQPQARPRVEESYIENIFRLNRGKPTTVYMTFENNKEWNAKIFKGIIEAAGRDHLILSDPNTGKRYLLPLIYLDFATFEGEIEYEYPFNNGAQ
ncbi:spore coat protein GerQ [Jeotgalibacillus terrae]|uniref:Spore coat protein GerQ n=1 Tax=Jeotgalibacillus terrae TaxID=587735 RepID=A0ABW5ZI28_9BACL|nr:spore coat protein GerQ [Jeotgalibacillus terrae]MBM7580328.1 spore germination protein Q [Jeotgalibacillus terrae]